MGQPLSTPKKMSSATEGVEMIELVVQGSMRDAQYAELKVNGGHLGLLWQPNVTVQCTHKRRWLIVDKGRFCIYVDRIRKESHA